MTVSGDKRSVLMTTTDVNDFASSPLQRRTAARHSDLNERAVRSSLLSPELRRTDRSWTVAEIREAIGEDGHQQRLRWAPKPVRLSSIRVHRNGQEYITLDGEQHDIAERSAPFVDEEGVQMCKVIRVDSWVSDDDMNEPQLFPSSPPQADNVGVGDSNSSSPVPNQLSSRQSKQDKHRASKLLSVTGRRSKSTHGSRRARSHSTIPAYTCPDLDLGRIKSFHEHPASDLYDYGPAIYDAIVEVKNRGKYDISTSNPSSVITRRLDDRPQRPVMFATHLVDRPSRTFNFNSKENDEAFLAHWTRYDVLEPCRRCADTTSAFRMFQGCVVADEFGGGACTNFHYSKRNTCCSSRRDSKLLGHRPCLSLKATD